MHFNMLCWLLACLLSLFPAVTLIDANILWDSKLGHVTICLDDIKVNVMMDVTIMFQKVKLSSALHSLKKFFTVSPSLLHFKALTYPQRQV